jgi:hypothetical protein
LPDRPDTGTESSASSQATGAVAKTPPARRIVVTSDQVYEEEVRRFRLIPLERVVFRYVLISAAVIGALVICGLVWLFLLLS